MIWENIIGKMNHKLRLKKLRIIPILGVVINIGTLMSLTMLGGCVGKPSVAQYTLTINTEGSGTTSGGGIYDAGTAVYISSNPDPEWEFVEWRGDTDTIGDHRSSRIMILMDKDYTITAIFTKLPSINPYMVSNVVFNPQWPATLNFGEWVKIEFKYVALDNALNTEDIPNMHILSDVNILARPFSDGALSPGYLARGYNFLQPWDKEGECEFTINPQPGQVGVDQVRFQITNADKTIILKELSFQVNYTFK